VLHISKFVELYAQMIDIGIQGKERGKKNKYKRPSRNWIQMYLCEP
jgi:hypothetical protein